MRRPKRKSSIENFKKERIKVKSHGENQVITIFTTETLNRGTPLDIAGALQNGLQELWGFLRSNRKPFRDETIAILQKHIKDRLSQSFGAAMIRSKDPTEIKALWDEIFPAAKTKETGNLKIAS